MYDTNAPYYPDTSTDEFFQYTTLKVDDFAGLQVRNGPYGALSSKELSDGTVHFCCPKDGSTEDFLEIANWITKNAAELLDKALKSLVPHYEEMRELVIDCLRKCVRSRLAPDS